MSTDLKVVLHHAVRELLANVAKHAQASSVYVSIRRDGADVRIRVEDDGIGFEPPTNGFRISRSGGYGLFHVGERLKQSNRSPATERPSRSSRPWPRYHRSTT
ncbi:MAG: sensor histidine kinase [Planctomycetota bacterium]